MDSANETDTIVVEELDPAFCEEVVSTPGGENIRKCFACGTCAAGCPVTSIDERYNARRIIRQVLLGMKEEVLTSPMLWSCFLCYRCYARCPQEVNFTDVMRALRYLAIKNGYISPRILSKMNEVDRHMQATRRDELKDTFEGREQILKEIGNLLEQERNE